jgi:hypothetical protein
MTVEQKDLLLKVDYLLNCGIFFFKMLYAALVFFYYFV